MLFNQAQHLSKYIQHIFWVRWESTFPSSTDWSKSIWRVRIIQSYTVRNRPLFLETPRSCYTRWMSGIYYLVLAYYTVHLRSLKIIHVERSSKDTLRILISWRSMEIIINFYQNNVIFYCSRYAWFQLKNKTMGMDHLPWWVGMQYTQILVASRASKTMVMLVSGA